MQEGGSIEGYIMGAVPGRIYDLVREGVLNKINEKSAHS